MPTVRRPQSSKENKITRSSQRCGKENRHSGRKFDEENGALQGGVDEKGRESQGKVDEESGPQETVTHEEVLPPKSGIDNQNKVSKDDEPNPRPFVELEMRTLDAQIRDKYDVGDVVHKKNAYVKVWTITAKDDDGQYTMKVIDKWKVREVERILGCGLRNHKYEASIHKDCVHPHIVKLIEDYENSDEIYLIMEYCGEVSY